MIKTFKQKQEVLILFAKMEITEFREKLDVYKARLDPSAFINAFIDAYERQGDNLELILQDMEQGVIHYKKILHEYVLQNTKKKKS